MIKMDKWSKIKENLSSSENPVKRKFAWVPVLTSKGRITWLRWIFVSESGESFTSIDHAIPVILPFIRRVMPEVIAHNIIGVQPMSSNAGQIHSLKIKYKSPDQTKDDKDEA